MMKMKSYLLICAALLWGGPLAAQVAALAELARAEERIRPLLAQVADRTLDRESKLAASGQIQELLLAALALEGSAAYPFDSLPQLGKARSEDGLVRVYTWSCPSPDGTFDYFGIVQRYDERQKRHLAYALTDASRQMENPEAKALGQSNWFGALYHQVVPLKHRGQHYYALVGWHGFDLLTSARVLEVMTFDNGGRPRFDSGTFPARPFAQHRFLLRHSAKVNVHMGYDPALDMVVFDYLTSSNPAMDQLPHYLGPDGTHDGLRFEQGAWKRESEVDARLRQR